MQRRTIVGVPLPEARICAWGGWGGSLALIDVNRRVTFAYVMNKMAPGIVGSIAGRLVKSLYELVN